MHTHTHTYPNTHTLSLKEKCCQEQDECITQVSITAKGSALTSVCFGATTLLCEIILTWSTSVFQLRSDRDTASRLACIRWETHKVPDKWNIMRWNMGGIDDAMTWYHWLLVDPKQTQTRQEVVTVFSSWCFFTEYCCLSNISWNIKLWSLIPPSTESGMVFYYIINCLGAEVFLSTEDIHTSRRKKGAIKHQRMMTVLHDENFASESQAAGISIVLSSSGFYRNANSWCVTKLFIVRSWHPFLGGRGMWEMEGHHSRLVNSFLVM